MPSGARSTRKKSGCGKYLLIGCGVLVVLGTIGAIGLYIAGNVLVGKVTEPLREVFMETEPRDLPQVHMPQHKTHATVARFDEFKRALQSNPPTEPLVLSSDEINVLIQHHPDLKGLSDNLYVTIQEDKGLAELSIPAGYLTPVLEGHYLNGGVVFTVSRASGGLDLWLGFYEVNRRPPSAYFMNWGFDERIAEKTMNHPEVRAIIEKLDKIEIRNGNLIMTAKTPQKPSDGFHR